MSIIFTDHFTSGTVGGPPPGWGGVGTITSDGINPTPTRAVAPEDMWVFPFGPGQAQGTIFFNFKIYFGAVQFNGPICVLYNSDPTVPGSDPLLSVVVEPDNSLSLITAGSNYLIDPVSLLPCNTGSLNNYYLPMDTYCYIGMTFQFSTVMGKIVAGGSITVNGGEGAISGSLNTGILATATFTGMANVNELDFKGGSFQETGVANVDVDDSPAAPYPNPVIPPAVLSARVSEFVLELIEQPTDANAFISQLGLELIELPTDANCRISQLVIELIGTNSPTPPGIGFAFWVDADLMESNNATVWIDYGN